MIEHPILFNATMVRAILDGRKTQTRRVVKLPKGIVSLYRPFPNEPQNVQGVDTDGLIGWYPGPSCCPYGQPGDKLWVRETWGCKAADRPGVPDGRKPQPGDAIQYAENGADAWQWRVPGSLPWRPSIHMPRWASRILLEVTDVRVQRVQEISYEDAIAEGITDPANMQEFPSGVGTGETVVEYCRRTSYPQREFRELWDSINERRGFGWDANPWVWCLTFKRVDEAKE